MFNIDENSRMDLKERLLFNIWQELKSLREFATPYEKNENFNIPVKVGHQCKYCGGVHEKPQQIAVCAKKNKKKE